MTRAAATALLCLLALGACADYTGVDQGLGRTRDVAGVAGPCVALTQPAFDRWDADGDRRLSIGEYMRCLSGRPGVGFTDLDDNRNGVLEPEEVGML